MPINPLNPFTVTPFWDDAIDLNKTNLARYMKERDASFLKLKKGAAAQVFYCRPAEAGFVVDHVVHEQSFARRGELLFRHCVVAVKNAKLRDGTTRAQYLPTDVAEMLSDESVKFPPTVPGRLEFTMSRAEMAEAFDATTVLEVGEVCRSMAFLPPGVGGSFALPPTSHRLLMTMQDRLAAYTRDRFRMGVITRKLAAEALAEMGEDADVWLGAATATE